MLNRSKNKKSKYPLIAAALVPVVFSMSTINSAHSRNMPPLLNEAGINKVSNTFNKIPAKEIVQKLLPEQDNWFPLFLHNLNSKIDIPYHSVFEFLSEQEEFKASFEVLKQLPAPIITIATPSTGNEADFVAVATATTWANKTLYLSEITLEYMASHLGASFGLGTTGGYGISTGIGGTSGLGASVGAGLATGIGMAAGLTSNMGVNIGTGGSLSVGAGTALGLPLTLNDIVTNSFDALRPIFWRVNTESSTALKTISPILVTIGNPDKNQQTARLNHNLPVFFEATDDDKWSVVHRRNGNTYDGHVGVISLSTRLPLPDINFKDGALGADMITLMIAATDDEGMQAASKLLEKNEDGIGALEKEVFSSYLHELITSGLNMTKPLERLKHFTTLAKETWSQPESPFTFMAQHTYDSHLKQVVSRAQETKTGRLLQRLSKKSRLAEKIKGTWTSRLALNPEILNGPAMVEMDDPQEASSNAISTTNLKMKSNLSFSYPYGLSLLVFSDDEGNPEKIQLIAH